VNPNWFGKPCISNPPEFFIAIASFLVTGSHKILALNVAIEVYPSFFKLLENVQRLSNIVQV
jgi:hypothetical protein